jgi:hypothetical protein
MSYFHQNFITTVIDLYGLELEDRQVDAIILTWLQKYDDTWIVKAIVESLYRGRYKIKSVDNILKDWQRLGKPRYNFTPDYEREILQNLPDLNDRPPSSVLSTSEPDTDPDADLDLDANFSIKLNSHHLNPEESEPFQCHNHALSSDLATTSAVGMLLTVEDRKIAKRALQSTREDKYAAFIYVPAALTILDGNIYISSKRQNKIQAERITAQPVKLQLFHTLKAIVDPNNHHQVVGESSSVGDNHATPDRYTHFHLPVEEQSV